MRIKSVARGREFNQEKRQRVLACLITTLSAPATRGGGRRGNRMTRHGVRQVNLAHLEYRSQSYICTGHVLKYRQRNNASPWSTIWHELASRDTTVELEVRGQDITKAVGAPGDLFGFPLRQRPESGITTGRSGGTLIKRNDLAKTQSMKNLRMTTRRKRQSHSCVIFCSTGRTRVNGSQTKTADKFGC
jgi:hypothetical protein